MFDDNSKAILLKVGNYTTNLEGHYRHPDSDVEDGPPFTIQRIAEVLVIPKRVSYSVFKRT